MVERANSTLALIHTKLRNRMDDLKLTMLCFLTMNCSLIYRAFGHKLSQCTILLMLINGYSVFEIKSFLVLRTSSAFKKSLFSVIVFFKAISKVQSQPF